jgi:tetratricopeptide (TPR) repeat protein
MVRRTLALVLAGALLGSVAAPAHAQDDDWSVKQNPFDPRIVNRYKALLEKNPNDTAALKKLVGLYAKYSTLEKLVGEYESKLAHEPGSFAYAMILGHLARQRNDTARAVTYYEKAAAARPDDASVNLALAELYRQIGKPDLAMGAYEKALAQSKDKKDKKPILRALADLALDRKDIDKARGYYKQYLDLDPRDVTARIELGEALAKHGLHQDALVELQTAAQQLATDPARRVEVLAHIGGELQALGKEDAAVEIYREAMGLTPKGHYLRKELTERIIEIYRKKQDLRGLIAYYEKVWPAGARGHFEWDILARLYEEAGEQDKSLDAYRHAVKVAPAELDTQKRLIAVLERAGKDDEALKQYEVVIRVAPGEPRFQLELAERYWKRGEKARALELARKIAGRFPDDGGVHAALADLYSRWSEDALALKEYEILARIEPEDETHLVNLGEQYFQRGDKAKAVEIWKRIIAKKTPEAYARLAEVYAEHDMGAEAIDMYMKAIALKPKEPQFYRGLAGVYERQRQDDRAIEAWEKVMELTRGDAALKPTRREARTRIIAILARKQGNPLTRKAMEWDRKFQGNPPDYEAGYFAAEAYIKQGRYEDAERVLRRVLSLLPDDLDAMHQLVAVYKSLHKYADAVDLLKQLADKSPGREREYYAQISELELALYNDDEAVAYAQKALEKSPSDPQAQERLAEIHEKRGDFDKAIEAYGRAIALAPRNYKTYFSLARLYLRKGQPNEAARLYREVMNRAGDEDTVRQAARKAIDLEEYLGTLGQLEREIVPLVFTYGQKPFYRRILVEIYDRYVPWLWARARRGDADAKKELAALGEHGLRPLLEALGDSGDPAQQKIAVAVLGYLGNKNAAPPLVKYAAEVPLVQAAPGGGTSGVGNMGAAPRLPGSSDDDAPGMDLRVEALVAAGRLGDARVVPQLAALLSQKEKALREAAAWALGRAGDAKAATPLIAALGDSQPSVQALACIGLGRLGDKRGLAAAAAHMRKAGVSADARAACAYALGVAGSASVVDDLVAVVDAGNDDLQRKAAWALGRIGDRRALPALLRAYWSKREAVREAIAWALPRVQSGKGDASVAPDEELVLDKGKIDYRGLVHGLLAELVTPALDPALVKGRAGEIVDGLTAALGRHSDIVLRALHDLDARDDGLALGRLTARLDDAPAADRDAVAAVLAQLGEKLEPQLLALCGHKDPEIRRLALSVLAKSGRAAALARLDKSLTDDDAGVRSAAISAAPRWIARARPGADELALLRTALAARLGASAWQERALAAQALGAIGGEASVPLLVRALADSSGFVREAATRALVLVGGEAAIEPLVGASRDDVAEVRLAAVPGLARAAKSNGKARARLAELGQNDPDERVRAAAAAP